MISKRLAGVMLGVSIVGGVLAGAAASVWTPDRPSAATPTRRPAAKPLPDVEVKKPVLVMNDDGGATLSATVVNHTAGSLRIDRAVGGQEEDSDAPVMLVHGTRSKILIEPGASMRIGGVDDPFRVRFADRVQVGSTLPVTLYFGHGIAMANGPTATLHAPVVARTTAHTDVANNGPNPDITVDEAKIVVVPGQEKAYIGGWFKTTIEDMTELRPTATGPGGRTIEVLHQTATGGPSGFFASPDQFKGRLGYPPYLDNGGDADYVRVSDVKVGQTIKVTFRFPSGDVVGRFKVVQGKGDGTI